MNKCEEIEITRALLLEYDRRSIKVWKRMMGPKDVGKKGGGTRQERERTENTEGNSHHSKETTSH